MNKLTKSMFIMLIAGVFAVYFTACNNNSVTTDDVTDDGYIKEVVGASNDTHDNDDDNNLFANENDDLDDGGIVKNHDGDTPIDSLLKWGRRITSVNVNANITNSGDTMKTVLVTKTITGNYYILGIVGGLQDTIIKPYTQVLRRTAIFKRIARTGNPRHNWKLYQVSMLDGNTTLPQNSDQYVQMQQLQVYVNGTLTYTFTGPDFTQNMFTTRRFDGTGIPMVNQGDNVRLVVTTFSTQSEPDYVAWHWARNAFGFHREPFVMTSSTPNGTGFTRTYEKTFTIFTGHLHNCSYNGYISSSTHKSLYDDSPAEFSSDLIGIPYRIHP